MAFSLLASSSCCTASSPTIPIRLSQSLAFSGPHRRLPRIASKTPQRIQHINVPSSQERGRPRDSLLGSGRAKEQSYPGNMSPDMISAKASLQIGSGSFQNFVFSLGEQASSTRRYLADTRAVKGKETRDVGAISMIKDVPKYDYYFSHQEYMHLALVPNKVLTETEGQGSVPPVGNIIQLMYFDHQRSFMKMPLKKEKLRVLLIGPGSRRIATEIAEVCVQSGNTTFALVTDTTPSDHSNSWILQKYKDMGVVLIQGDLNNHESLVKAVKAVDVVISVVGYAELTDQIKIIDAIKEAGNIKRFIITAELINDVNPGDHVVDPAESYGEVAQIRQIVEAAGIPYTFISYNFPDDPFLTSLGGIGIGGRPTDGNLKGKFQLFL